MYLNINFNINLYFFGFAQLEKKLINHSLYIIYIWSIEWLKNVTITHITMIIYAFRYMNYDISMYWWNKLTSNHYTKWTMPTYT